MQDPNQLKSFLTRTFSTSLSHHQRRRPPDRSPRSRRIHKGAPILKRRLSVSPTQIQPALLPPHIPMTRRIPLYTNALLLTNILMILRNHQI